MSETTGFLNPVHLNVFLLVCRTRFELLQAHCCAVLLKIALDFRILQLSDSSNNIFNEADTGDFEAVWSVLL